MEVTATMQIREAGQAARAPESAAASRRSLFLIPQKLFEVNKICQDRVGPHPFVVGCGGWSERFEARKWRVHIVHTLGLGLDRTTTGLGRIPHVFAGCSAYKGWNAVRVPPRAQCFRRSGAFYPYFMVGPG